MNENSLYKKFHNKIFVYLKRHVSDEDAEELAQDVFVKATKNLERFRGESSHQTWLYRIATNCLKDFYKSRSMREKGLIEEAELESFPVDELSPEDEQLTVEMNACISEFIHRLPENYAAVLALHELEGFKIKEIAEVIEAADGPAPLLQL